MNGGGCRKPPPFDPCYNYASLFVPPTPMPPPESSVFPHNGSTYRIGTVAQQGQRFPCTRPGYEPHPTICYKYYHCQEVDSTKHAFRVTHFSCREGLMFDASTITCNIPSRSRSSCITRHPNSVTSTLSSLTSNSSFSTSSTSSTATRYATKHTSSINSASALLNNNDTSKPIIQASKLGLAGQYTSQTGPGGTTIGVLQGSDFQQIQHQQQRRKEHQQEQRRHRQQKQKQQHQQRQRQEIENTTPPELPCPGSGIYKHPTNCSQLYRCMPNSQGGFTAFVSACPDKKVWDSKRAICDIPSKVLIPCGFLVHETPGISTRHPTEATSVSLVSAEPATFTPSDSSLLTQKPLTTVVPPSTTLYGEISLDEGKFIGKSMSGESNSTAKNLTCSRNGVFRNPYDCHQFYTCTFSSGTQTYQINHFNCPEKLVFDERISRCAWSNRAHLCKGSAVAVPGSGIIQSRPTDLIQGTTQNGWTQINNVKSAHHKWNVDISENRIQSRKHDSNPRDLQLINLSQLGSTQGSDQDNRKGWIQSSSKENQHRENQRVGQESQEYSNRSSNKDNQLEQHQTTSQETKQIFMSRNTGYSTNQSGEIEHNRKFPYLSSHQGYHEMSALNNKTNQTTSGQSSHWNFLHQASQQQMMNQLSQQTINDDFPSVQLKDPEDGQTPNEQAIGTVSNQQTPINDFPLPTSHRQWNQHVSTQNLDKTQSQQVSSNQNASTLSQPGSSQTLSQNGFELVSSDSNSFPNSSDNGGGLLSSLLTSFNSSSTPTSVSTAIRQTPPMKAGAPTDFFANEESLQISPPILDVLKLTEPANLKLRIVVPDCAPNTIVNRELRLCVNNRGTGGENEISTQTTISEGAVNHIWPSRLTTSPTSKRTEGIIPPKENILKTIQVKSKGTPATILMTEAGLPEGIISTEAQGTALAVVSEINVQATERVTEANTPITDYLGEGDALTTPYLIETEAPSATDLLKVNAKGKTDVTNTEPLIVGSEAPVSFHMAETDVPTENDVAAIENPTTVSFVKAKSSAIDVTPTTTTSATDTIARAEAIVTETDVSTISIATQADSPSTSPVTATQHSVTNTTVAELSDITLMVRTEAIPAPPVVKAEISSELTETEATTSAGVIIEMHTAPTQIIAMTAYASEANASTTAYTPAVEISTVMPLPDNYKVGSLFDPSKQEESAKFVCQQRGTFAYSGDCRKYIRCVPRGRDFRTVLLNCFPGSVYDEGLKVCVRHRGHGCKSKAPTTPPLRNSPYVISWATRTKTQPSLFRKIKKIAPFVDVERPYTNAVHEIKAEASPTTSIIQSETLSTTYMPQTHVPTRNHMAEIDMEPSISLLATELVPPDAVDKNVSTTYSMAETEAPVLLDKTDTKPTATIKIAGTEFPVTTYRTKAEYPTITPIFESKVSLTEILNQREPTTTGPVADGKALTSISSTHTFTPTTAATDETEALGVVNGKEEVTSIATDQVTEIATEVATQNASTIAPIDETEDRTRARFSILKSVHYIDEENSNASASASVFGMGDRTQSHIFILNKTQYITDEDGTLNAQTEVRTRPRISFSNDVQSIGDIVSTLSTLISPPSTRTEAPIYASQSIMEAIQNTSVDNITILSSSSTTPSTQTETQTSTNESEVNEDQDTSIDETEPSASSVTSEDEAKAPVELDISENEAPKPAISDSDTGGLITTSLAQKYILAASNAAGTETPFSTQAIEMDPLITTAPDAEVSAVAAVVGGDAHAEIQITNVRNPPSQMLEVSGRGRYLAESNTTNHPSNSAPRRATHGYSSPLSTPIASTVKSKESLALQLATAMKLVTTAVGRETADLSSTIPLNVTSRENPRALLMPTAQLQMITEPYNSTENSTTFFELMKVRETTDYPHTERTSAAIMATSVTRLPNIYTDEDTTSPVSEYAEQVASDAGDFGSLIGTPAGFANEQISSADTSLDGTILANRNISGEDADSDRLSNAVTESIRSVSKSITELSAVISELPTKFQGDFLADSYQKVVTEAPEQSISISSQLPLSTDAFTNKPTFRPEPGTGGETDFGRPSGPPPPEPHWNSPVAPPLSNQELPSARPGSYPGETGIEITPPAARPCTGDCDLHCSGPGFFRHPKDCSNFIRCVENEERPGQFQVGVNSCQIFLEYQLLHSLALQKLASKVIQVYEFECPAGLIFDEQASTCNWPEQTQPCQAGEYLGFVWGPKPILGGSTSLGGGQPGALDVPVQGQSGGLGFPGDGQSPAHAQPGQGGFPRSSSQPDQGRYPDQGGQGGYPYQDRQGGYPGQNGQGGYPGQSGQGRQTPQNGQPSHGGFPPSPAQSPGSGLQQAESTDPHRSDRNLRTYYLFPGSGALSSTSGGCNPCSAAGFFRHPSSCEKFIRCVDFFGNGQFTVFNFACPAGLVFDERFNVCNWPHEAPPCDSVAAGNDCSAGQSPQRPAISGPESAPHTSHGFQGIPPGTQHGPAQSDQGSRQPQSPVQPQKPSAPQQGGWQPPSYEGSSSPQQGRWQAPPELAPSGPQGPGQGQPKPFVGHVGPSHSSWQPAPDSPQQGSWQPQTPPGSQQGPPGPSGPSRPIGQQQGGWQPQGPYDSSGSQGPSGPQNGGWQPPASPPSGRPQGTSGPQHGGWQPQGPSAGPDGPQQQQPQFAPQSQTAVGPPVNSPGGCSAQCTSTGFFRNPTNCHKFYRCVDFYQNGQYTIFHFDCPGGLVFDERISVCNWPQNSPPCNNAGGGGGGGCAGAPQPPAIAPPTQDFDQFDQGPPQDYGQGPQSGPPEPGSAGPPSVPQHVPPSQKNCPSAGFFRNPQNCNKFFRCVDFWGNGDYTIFHFDCPGGLVFDERSSVCNWPDQAPPCDGADAPARYPQMTPPSKVPPAPELPTEPPEMAPADTEMTTEMSTELTTEMMETTTPSRTPKNLEDRKKKPKRIKCPDKSNHEVPGDCTKFYRCAKVGVGKRAQLFQCMEGYIFDQEIQFCKKMPPGFKCMTMMTEETKEMMEEMGRAEMAPPEMYLD
ncbi:hypothetical protein BIW11_09233 [Tropilaelaps mercedesae]|uniref:Chitin-binding type-2 domain-containing protein n=1 Tax=Tropilaelaps mercedesae TaxID=418985 RepID=A0A1V9XKZ0_9ACAR|nr:hypothetical protein BIW11_09233 [Tropilaelaps mercedesae]